MNKIIKVNNLEKSCKGKLRVNNRVVALQAVKKQGILKILKKGLPVIWAVL